MILIKYLKYFLLTLVIVLFTFLPLKVSAEEVEPIEINRKVSISYSDITGFNIFEQTEYSVLVYMIEDFFTRYNIDNNNGLYPYGISLKSQLVHYYKEAEQWPINDFYRIVGGSYNTNGNYFLIVNNNDLYIMIDSRLKPVIHNNIPAGIFRFTWSEFQLNPSTNLYSMFLNMHNVSYTENYIITEMTYIEYFNAFGFYLEFTQYVENPEELDYDVIYQDGFEKGRQQGIAEGDAAGYSRGYKAGKEYGMSIADGEVNALASIVPNIVGTIWGVTKDFLSISIYGISPWQIFAALSSIALILLAIKIIR